MQQWTEALVEARRIDDRLNAFSDETEGEDTYHEDPFARYLVGLLYDITGDTNNAYVGYRKAEQVYEEGQVWIRVPIPDVLKHDLIRTADRLGLYEDVQRYKEKYPGIVFQSLLNNTRNLAQIVVMTYHGQGPKKEDLTIDVPVSLDALQLVAATQATLSAAAEKTTGKRCSPLRPSWNVLHVLPYLVFLMHKPSRWLNIVQLHSPTTEISTRTHRMYDVNAVAEKTLADAYDSLVLRAVARTAIKMVAAEGIGLGASAAAGKNARNWIGPLVGGIARIFALATEEADVRSWRTLPGEFQLARLWVEPGDYAVRIASQQLQNWDPESSPHERLQLKEGETRFLLHQNFR